MPNLSSIRQSMKEKSAENCDWRTETRTETRTDRHHYTIIRPVWRRAYKKIIIGPITAYVPMKCFGQKRKICMFTITCWNTNSAKYMWCQRRKDQQQTKWCSDLLLSVNRHSLFLFLLIWNIAINVASTFTGTCRWISTVVTSSKYVGNFGHRSNLTWSFEQVFPRFTGSSKPS